MPASPDVLVIGAGIVGSAAAWELAAAGARVRLVDMRRPGAGATQASAGMLAPYVEGHGSEALTELGRRSLAAYDAFVARVAAELGRAPIYNRRGTLEVARDAAHAARLQTSARTLAEAGVEAEWLDRAALARTEPLVGPGALGGLLVRAHGFVDARGMAAALAEAACARGASLHAPARVHRIARVPDGRVRVESDEGEWVADRVVLAAGSWSGRVAIEGASPAPVTPVRGQLLHLAWSDQPMAHIVWGADCYVVPWPQGDVLVGATVEHAGFDERTTAGGVAALLAAALALVPRLADAAFIAARAGLRPASPDDLPIVGRSSAIPGLVYATAHYRNGVLLAPLTAALVRGLVFDEPADPALALLSPARFGAL